MKMTSLKNLYLILALLVSASVAIAADDVPAEVKGVVESALKNVLPDSYEHGEVVPTPIPGLYKVAVQGGGFLFVTADGEYLISGELYQNKGDELVNLSENERKVQREALLSQVDESDMIIFPAKGKRKAYINVFTDVDCGYCRKLHQHVPELNEHGVEVRYLAFPRAGLASMSYAKIATAWCDADPQKALTELKKGETMKLNVCEDNPVAKDYQLGLKMGIQGTPAIILADGTLIPGYQPAEELLKTLGL